MDSMKLGGLENWISWHGEDVHIINIWTYETSTYLSEREHCFGYGGKLCLPS